MFSAFHKKNPWTQNLLKATKIMPQPSTISPVYRKGHRNDCGLSLARAVFYEPLWVHVDAKKQGGATDMPTRNGKSTQKLHKHRLMYINICSKNTCWAIKVGDPSPIWSILESHFEDPCDGWHLRCVAGFYSWLMAKSRICVNMWYLFCHASWQICTRNTELEFERGFQTAMSKSIQSSLDSAQKDRSFENNMKKWFHCSAMESSKNKRGFWVKLIIVHQPEICWFRLLVRLPFWVKLVIHFKIIAHPFPIFSLCVLFFAKEKVMNQHVTCM